MLFILLCLILETAVTSWCQDPPLRYSRDEESNQTVIEGMAELHLEIIIDCLKREFKAGVSEGRS